MKGYLKEKIVDIVDGKLSSSEVEELIDFFRHVIEKIADQGDEAFFRELAFEMSSSVKELALLIIDFRREMKSKVQPEITDLATKHIPQAADQLEGIIETTEVTANKIMDNLEAMQEDAENMAEVLTALKSGRVVFPGAKKKDVRLEPQTTVTLSPLTEYMDLTIGKYKNFVSDIFVQMSFQDLTGQRIKRIMALVREMEVKLKKMVVSFGIKLAEKEKNPEITAQELREAVAEKESELAGPQKTGCGLDQAGIDDLLASI